MHSKFRNNHRTFLTLFYILQVDFKLNSCKCSHSFQIQIAQRYLRKSFPRSIGNGQMFSFKMDKRRIIKFYVASKWIIILFFPLPAKSLRPPAKSTHPFNQQYSFRHLLWISCKFVDEVSKKRFLKQRICYLVNLGGDWIYLLPFGNGMKLLLNIKFVFWWWSYHIAGYFCFSIGSKPNPKNK